MGTVAVVIHRIQFLHTRSSLGNVCDVRLGDAAAAADQVHNSIGELMRNKARTFAGGVALVSQADGFAVLSGLEVTQTRFNRDAATTDLGAAVRDKLSMDSSGCPGFRINVGRAAEFSQRVETSTNQGQSACIVEIVP